MLILDKDKTKDQTPTYQMEERVCRECGNPFRVLTSSSQVFCSNLCQTASPLKNPKPKKTKKQPWETYLKDQERHGAGVLSVPPPTHVDGRDRPKAKPVEIKVEIKSPVRQIETTPDRPVVKSEIVTPTRMIDIEDTQAIELPGIEISDEPQKVKDEEEADRRWKKYVSHAKTYVKTLNRARMEVARLALSACNVQWGGGNHWKNFEGVFTLKRFAEEIGMHPKTLGEWCAVRRLVHDKLPEGIFQDHNYMAAQRTRMKIDRNTLPDEVLKVYKKELTRESDSYYFCQALKRLKTTKHLVTKKLDLDKVDRTELTEMRELCKAIQDKIDAQLKG